MGSKEVQRAAGMESKRQVQCNVLHHILCSSILGGAKNVLEHCNVIMEHIPIVPLHFT